MMRWAGLMGFKKENNPQPDNSGRMLAVAMQIAEGRYDWALLGYLKASEAGYELAQANAAWMLGQGYGLPVDQSASGHVEPGASPDSPQPSTHKKRLTLQGDDTEVGHTSRLCEPTNICSGRKTTA